MPGMQDLKLRTKAVLIVGLILVFALGSITLLMVRTSTSDLEEALQGKALVLGQEMANELRRFFSIGVELDDLKNFSERCEELVASHDNFAFAFVTDGKGRIRYHSDRTQIGKRVPSVFFDVSSPPGNVLQRPVAEAGEKSYGTVIPIYDRDGVYRTSVVLSLMGRAVYGKISRQVRNSLLIGTISFAAALLLTIFFFTGQVVRPLSGLVKSSKAAAGGDLSQNIQIRSRDEIGELSRAFGEMLSQIDKRDQELNMHRLQLEKLVEARTSELGLTNENLERELAERTKAENALRSSEEEYRRLSQEFHALLDAIPDRITLLSTDLKVLWANQGAVKGLCPDAGDAVGRFCHGLWHGRTTPCHPCPVERTFHTGNSENDSMPSADGRYWDVRTIPLTNQDGKVRSVIEVARDVTEQRRLEGQLRHSQKIEAVGQLAGGVAHDFNNILNAIMGFATLIQIKTQGDEDLKQYVQQIVTSTERAADLTHGLLAFSRKQILDPVPVDLNTSLRKVEKLLSRLISEDIALSINTTDGNLTVLADSNQIDQVLINLATNARDAMPDGGSLIFGTEQVHIGDDFVEAHGYGETGVYARISVSDTGSGMSEKIQRRIFEPFFTTKDLGKGTGLGLAIVYGIIKQHGGFINCYSEPGSGTTFKIYLPLTEMPAEKVAARVPETVQGGKETVLVAEDDNQVRTLTVELLKQYGYSVVAARDGEEAVRLYRQNNGRIHLLLLDVIMPGMNGREVYDAIRAITPRVKVLFTSGYTADIIHQKGILEKDFNFIFKPAQPQELLNKVREVLETPSRFN